MRSQPTGPSARLQVPELDKVVCTAADRCYASGYKPGSSFDRKRPLYETWNGRQWVILSGRSAPISICRLGEECVSVRR